MVYQAFRPSTGLGAAAAGRFVEGFSLSRMSWIKPNFLWMMYRCGWATKEAQEVVLAIRMLRSGFDAVLRDAVHSTFVPDVYGDEATWKRALALSGVRLQWDPDHDPSGQRVERRAIQLGLSGEVLRSYAREWVVGIDDITDFVREQCPNSHRDRRERLLTPREEVYPVNDREVAARLGVDDS